MQVLRERMECFGKACFGVPGRAGTVFEGALGVFVSRLDGTFCCRFPCTQKVVGPCRTQYGVSENSGTSEIAQTPNGRKHSYDGMFGALVLMVAYLSLYRASCGSVPIEAQQHVNSVLLASTLIWFHRFGFGRKLISFGLPFSMAFGLSQVLPWLL